MITQELKQQQEYRSRKDAGLNVILRGGLEKQENEFTWLSDGPVW